MSRWLESRYRVDERIAARSGCRILCGIDEAGRGPWAGPVIAAAVVLDLGRPIPGINDSKVLSPQERERLAVLIRANALDWSCAAASADEIDRTDILRATLSAMRQAVEGLSVKPGIVLVDGPHLPGLGIRQMNLIKGDGRSASIAAASIIAKVTRDEIMEKHNLTYPQYGFGRHKGYGTPEHRRALDVHGLSPIHRTRFGPCRQILDRKRPAAAL